MPASSVDPWIALSALGFGVLFAAMGVATLVRAARRRRHWHVHQGTVVASRLDDGQFRFQVAFAYGGREIRFWNPYTTASGVDPVGRDVEVLVNPDDPAQAVVSRGQSRPEVVGAAFLAFGVVALLIGARLAR
jgi:Protein of unknown function (DUF3592)